LERPVTARAILIRVLVGFGAPQGKEHLFHVARQELGKLGAEPGPRFRRHEGADVRQLLSLPVDGFDDPPVAVPGVDAHELTVEVEVSTPVGVVEVDALRARDWERLEA
jgi:hypothetical protein